MPLLTVRLACSQNQRGRSGHLPPCAGNTRCLNRRKQMAVHKAGFSSLSPGLQWAYGASLAGGAPKTLEKRVSALFREKTQVRPRR